MAVITRSQRQCQAEQEEKEVQGEERQGVEATPVITGSEEAQEAIQQEQQDAGVFPLTNFHEDRFGPQKSRKKASRKQKRLLKQQIRQDINSELREQQSMDPSLEEVRRLAQAKQFGFFFFAMDLCIDSGVPQADVEADLKWNSWDCLSSLGPW